MPTYEYRCTKCGEHLEVVQSFKDAPLTECPHCAGELRKVFSPVGIVFKGSGFYKTDSRSGGKKSSMYKDKESSSSSSSDSSSSSTSDSSSSSSSSTSSTSDSSSNSSKKDSKIA
ncbi:MAG: FmdB family transcriptional regulator [Actinobacteria bacterium]|nr:FmdB family transcriptional regulator [Actinomycetota bacterium]